MVAGRHSRRSSRDRLGWLRRRHGVSGDEELLCAVDAAAPPYFISARADLHFGRCAADLLALAGDRHPWTSLLAVWAAFTAPLSPGVQALAGAAPGVRAPSTRRVSVIPAAQRVRALFEAADDGRGILYADYVAGCIGLAEGDLVVAAAWLGQVIEHAGTAARRDPIVSLAMSHRALAVWALGEVREAFELAGRAAALAVALGVPRAEAMALILFSGFNVMAGELDVAASSLQAARAAQDRIEDPLERFDEPLHDAVSGLLHAVHGREPEALAAFERATGGPVQYATVARALRTEFLPDWQPDATRLATRQIVDTLDDLGENGWLWHWARRAHAIACRETGEVETSIALLEDLLAEPLTSLERGRTLLALAESLLRSQALRVLRAGPSATAAACQDPVGSRTVELLLEAIRTFDCIGGGFGAGYWVARACARLGEIDRVRYRAFERRAHGIVRGPAARVRLHGTARLRFSLLGESVIFVNGRAASHGSWRASLLLHALAIAGGRLSRDRLAEMLWPDDPDPTRLRRNLNTVRYHAARLVLGSEQGWRLDVVGDTVRLDLTGVHVDVTEAKAMAASVLGRRLPVAEAQVVGRRAMELMTSPLLAPWADFAWVVAEQEALRRLAGQVADYLARLGAPA